MYLHTKYGTATINNIGNLLWEHFFKTWLLISRSQWQKWVSDIPWPQHISTNWIWGFICHIIWDMLLTLCFACCRWVVLSVNSFCLHTTVMLTVCYINRQPGSGYHYSDTNACGALGKAPQAKKKKRSFGDKMPWSIYSYQYLQIKRNLFRVKVRDKWRHKCLMRFRNIGNMHFLTHWKGGPETAKSKNSANLNNFGTQM